MTSFNKLLVPATAAFPKVSTTDWIFMLNTKAEGGRATKVENKTKKQTQNNNNSNLMKKQKKT